MIHLGITFDYLLTIYAGSHKCQPGSGEKREAVSQATIIRGNQANQPDWIGASWHHLTGNRVMQGDQRLGGLDLLYGLDPVS